MPFAIKFPEGALAMPAKLAMQIIEGLAPVEDTLQVTETIDPSIPS